MKTNTKNSIGILIALAVIAVAGYALSRDAHQQSTGNETPNTNMATTTSITATTTETTPGISLIETGASTVTTSGSLPSVPIPNLDRSEQIPKTMPADIANKTLRSIAEVTTSLKNDPNDIAGWSNLGLLRKSLGDYEGARQAWEYAAALRPHDYLAFVNLGDLYGYYLKDPVQAEKNFTQAIENDPTRVYLYFKTYEFYRDSNNPDKARAVVERGITANPDSAELKSLLQSIK